MTVGFEKKFMCDQIRSNHFESKEITLLRVWGVHIDDEMSEHVLNKSEDIQQHIAWLKSEQ